MSTEPWQLHPGGAVANDGIVLPAALPQPVHDLEVLLGHLVAPVVGGLGQYWYEYQRWLERRRIEPPASLTTVLVGGERMDASAYRRWQRDLRPRLVHVYGLTECTVTSTMFDGLMPDDAAEVPLGSALAGCGVELDDERGEIVVQGRLVGRGYLGDEVGTAARFVDEADGRQYFTGDIGRIDNGQLVFLGRRDSQLKIRGHRVEPTAVERRLEGVPGVVRAAVVPDPRASTSLAAAIVLEDPRPAEKQLPAPVFTGGLDLAEHLGDVLHAWEVPARYVEIAAMPLTSHGKINRDAVVALVAAAAPAPTATATADYVEAVVLAWFRDVLGDDVEPDGDFFEYGGNSLLAMRVADGINDALDIDVVGPALVYDTRTVKNLADVVRKLGDADGHTKAE